MEDNLKRYYKLEFKIPIESDDYEYCSEYVIRSIEEIISESIKNGKNKIIINTNLRFGLPMENINKIAGPFIEAWAYQTFYEMLEDKNNKYNLINVEAKERLNMADIILQFKRQRKNESSWEFCRMLDKKFMSSKKDFNEWLELAQKENWIK